MMPIMILQNFEPQTKHFTSQELFYLNARKVEEETQFNDIITFLVMASVQNCYIHKIQEKCNLAAQLIEDN